MERKSDCKCGDFLVFPHFLGFPCDSAGKESACNMGDLGSTPGLGRSPGGGNGNHSSVLAWRIPRAEEPGGPQSMGLQRVGHDRATKHSTLYLLRESLKIIK